MRKSMKMIPAILLTLVLVCALMPSAFAIGGEGWIDHCTAEIPVTVKAVNVAADPLQRAPELAYTVTIFDESGNPVDTLTFTNGVPSPDEADTYIYTGTFKLEYDRVGEHVYTIRQTVSDDTRDNYCRSYGDNAYNFRIYIINGATGIESKAFMTNSDFEVDENLKQSSCVYENVYGTNVTLVKMWHGAMAHVLQPVTFELVRGDSTQKVSLSDADQQYFNYEQTLWQRSMTLPYDYRYAGDPTLGFTVTEDPVPSGFLAIDIDPVLSEDGRDVAVGVANYHILIQTGQLIWPIPVLAGIGLLFVGVGLLLCRKGKRDA